VLRQGRFLHYPRESKLVGQTAERDFMADGFDSAGESTAPVAANFVTFGTK
jgi:hypothetical protein